MCPAPSLKDFFKVKMMRYHRGGEKKRSRCVMLLRCDVFLLDDQFP